MKWILASASPRRKELLGALLERFEILPACGEEKGREPSPDLLVEALAREKAREVAARPEGEGAFVLGADTVVVLDGEVLGKPKDEEDARRMLLSLSDRSHEVYTGVCIARRRGEEWKILVRNACTRVNFRPLSKEFIEEYIRGGSPMDKAGGYGIQDGGLVESVEGSYTNVVGLPQELVKEMIEKVAREWND